MYANVAWPGARFFVQSISSFATMLAVMSPHLERTYIPKKVTPGSVAIDNVSWQQKSTHV